jgi:hypothetical protein
MKQKPFYSIQELAEILDEKVYRVADGLFAYSIPAIFCGKQIVLSDYACFRPPNDGNVMNIYAFSGERPASPRPSNVCVATEKLPQQWIDCIERAESTVNGYDVAKVLPGRWPWGDYETDLLRKLAAVADRFWKLYDPTDNTTAPTNKQVIAWLKKQDVADRTAEVMATILRADGLPPGPRK